MRMYDIIKKKKGGGALSETEIGFVVKGFTAGEIPDYQMSALLMAVCLKGMTDGETACLTLAMANSGDVVDLSGIEGLKVDKHSTGGVGDKTTLIISPIVASLGVPIAKMSGRGLGHTGGTVDKLESVPGLRTAFSREEFISIVKTAGLCVAGQSANLAPADKKIYALRDVTATVDSIPLIAASIMSKKIAAGSNCILLDVKTGSGAFMKTTEESIALARAMVDIGEAAGRKTVALITDMDIPLGYAIGNSLEIIEAAETLRGRGPKDLTDVCIALAEEMLVLSGRYSRNECAGLINDAIRTGRAFETFVKMVRAQGGDAGVIENTDRFEKARVVHEVKALESGFVYKMDAEGCGAAACMLGAGRETEKSAVDFSAGIILKAKTGDYVDKGQVLAQLHTSDMDKCRRAEERLLACYDFSAARPSETLSHVYARVDKEKTVVF